MCPLCIGTAALLVSGGTSAGGLAALFFKQRACGNRSIAPRADSCDSRAEELNPLIESRADPYTVSAAISP